MTEMAASARFGFVFASFLAVAKVVTGSVNDASGIYLTVGQFQRGTFHKMFKVNRLLVETTSGGE